MSGAGPALLVIGLSARALAEAAARAGFRPVAVDFFADVDTEAAALHAERYDGPWGCGFRRDRLLPAIDRAVAAAGVDPIGLVLGSGFEDRPRLIARLASRWPLLGTGADAVAAVKSPERFAAFCRNAGIPHPEIRRDVSNGGDFLLKRRAGTGGAHVRPAPAGPVPPGFYAQRRVPGEPIAAAVLSTGRAAAVIAWTAQWSDPTAASPYRFAGVGGPVHPPAALAAAMEQAATAVAIGFGLRGLASVDMLAGPDGFHVLEANPRPGGSLDVLDRADPPLLRAHREACEGRLPAVRVDHATIRVTEVVHAASDSAWRRDSAPPAWLLDRPRPGTRFSAGEPIATVTAEGNDLATARATARIRMDALRGMTGEGEHG